MKSLFTVILLLWLAPWPVKGQTRDTTVLRIDKLVDGYAPVTTGGKWRVGDNPAWAEVAYDDQGWSTLSLDAIRNAPQTDIFWVRHRFRVADSLRGRSLVLLISQYAASEIYLNGRLLRRYGKISSQTDRMQALFFSYSHKPIGVTFNRAEHVLAIRAQFWPFRNVFNPVLVFYPHVLAAICTPEALARRIAEDTILPTLDWAMMILFLLLVGVHLTYFFYYPKQRANLYFVVCAVVGLAGFASALQTWRIQPAERVVGLTIAYYGLFVAYELLSAGALYALFAFRAGRWYGGLWVAALLSFGIFVFTQSGWYGLAVAMLLGVGEQLRLTLLALRTRRRGARIIASGFAGGLLVLLLLAVLRLGGVPTTYGLEAGLYGLLFALPSLGISLFLAREFALDSQLLQEKLVQVEELSTLTLRQQWEKQDLLTRQNETLERQVTERTAHLQQTLTNLQITQNQLIHAEKMASLGELTAGIAHEIQNPLNFVNNFAEVSTELIAELEAEREKPVQDEKLEADLLNDVKQNLYRISEQGNRASLIVRGMLAHSRTDTGPRQATDLNQLVAEYASLAYQGLRAKDKSFHCRLTTHFDADIDRVDVIPPELGRVVLNLCTNAFYAVQQQQHTGPPAYQPTVTVRTEKVGQRVIIGIADNGTGIPEAVRTKIFQPFFTTKPTGQGTGLGLSLAYDIITKLHGGTLVVTSQEGQGSEFVITLPMT